MAKSMYNFGKHAREKARQQKQMEKAEKRMIAKQQKANMKTDAPNADSNTAGPEPAEETSKSIA
ncbi:MAG: hypothetical protein JW914_04330 [Syntrophaceae bacterium]|nr:hypothetical protein [Syntrophaceae bacterium]